MDIEEWLQYTDFMYEQKLAELIEKVEAAGASAFMGPKWKEAKHRNELTWWHNLHQFVKFLFIQSRMRIVSLVATAALAAVSSSISTKLSSIEDSLLQAVTNQVFRLPCVGINSSTARPPTARPGTQSEFPICDKRCANMSPEMAAAQMADGLGASTARGFVGGSPGPA